jgi:hypothetical protein
MLICLSSAKKAKFTGLTDHRRAFLPDGVAVRPVREQTQV